MIVAAVHLASLASLFTAVQGALVVSESSRGIARSAVVTQGTDYDADLRPTVDFRLHSGKDELVLAYDPLLTLRSFSSPSDRAFTVLHNGLLRLALNGHDYHLTLSQTGSYGSQSFTALRAAALMNPGATLGTGGPRLDLIPSSTSVVKVASEESVATFVYDWTRRLHQGLTASYGIGGGRDAAAQAILPRLKTANAATFVDWQLARTDDLGANLDGAHVTTSNGQTHLTLALTAGWGHQFSKGFSTRLTGGATGVRSVTAGTVHRKVLPTGALSASLDFVRVKGLVWTFTANGGLGPVLNNLTGDLQQRAFGAGTFLVQVGDLRFSAGGDIGQTIPRSDPQAVRLIGVGATAAYSPAKMVDITAEYRSAWQSSLNPMAPPASGMVMNPALGSLPRQWIALVGVTVRSPTLTF
jgi:hypothetical protein